MLKFSLTSYLFVALISILLHSFLCEAAGTSREVVAAITVACFCACASCNGVNGVTITRRGTHISNISFSLDRYVGLVRPNKRKLRPFLGFFSHSYYHTYKTLQMGRVIRCHIDISISLIFLY